MKLLHLLPSLLCVGLAKAYLVAPPGTPAPGATQRCSGWVQASYALSCDIIVGEFGMTLSLFQEWNPATSMLGAGCNLIRGLDYCTEVDFIRYTTMTTEQSTTSSLGTATAVSTANPASTTSAISTPAPIQSGMVANCNRFYYVKSGDVCANIASAQGISLAQLYAWNPAISTNCQGLWADVYICVGLAGVSPPPSTTITTAVTTGGNSITTPTPTQAGMVANCNRFYFVNSGDICADIVTSQGISFANLYAWNPAIGNSCGGLWANVYICVGVGTMTPTTTAPGNGVATPTPIQAGMTTRCKTFHLVAAGEVCFGIARPAGISIANFYAWNPAVGTNCGALLPGYYVCIALL